MRPVRPVRPVRHAGAFRAAVSRAAAMDAALVLACVVLACVVLATGVLGACGSAATLDSANQTGAGSDSGGQPSVTGSAASSPTTGTATTAPPTTGPATTGTTTRSPSPSAGTGAATAAPSWLGRRVLALRSDGYGVMGPTPADLDPRDILTVDVLPPPADGRFHSSVSAVPASVAARSTWGPECPVTLTDLRYVTVSFIGFDGRPHTGELLTNRTAAAAMVRVFGKLFAARFPIERMVVTTVAERDAPPTGDGNTTGSFNCRSAAGATHWSQHAYGLAIDVNPFMNPYLKSDVILPELARTYRDRADVRPGMHTRGGVAVRAFAAEGWIWGGSWKSLKDFMHFSPSGT